MKNVKKPTAKNSKRLFVTSEDVAWTLPALNTEDAAIKQAGEDDSNYLYEITKKYKIEKTLVEVPLD